MELANLFYTELLSDGGINIIKPLTVGSYHVFRISTEICLHCRCNKRVCETSIPGNHFETAKLDILTATNAKCLLTFFTAKYLIFYTNAPGTDFHFIILTRVKMQRQIQKLNTSYADTRPI